ncbi:PH (Pleckstrin Homology) domain-containing protein [Saccharothrix australiensis]|uniref:PH (Pleckstrin Homology) domain-containing protein n=1 Tax=Saccharothrix australiensis TaxID=2072 RepID=A0A495VR15_9PSEU|nr:PH (Pleckstrin Homology) domain-containing protein [Saccharothrix australiensis]
MALAWLLAATSLVFAVLGPEPTTRLFLGTATAFLLALAAYGTFVRPKLTADDTGLTVRTVTGRRHLPWHQVKVKLVHTRRLGREVATLELDWQQGDDEQLFVLTPMDLGADPRDVADVLHALRP